MVEVPSEHTLTRWVMESTKQANRPFGRAGMPLERRGAEGGGRILYQVRVKQVHMTVVSAPHWAFDP